MNHAARRSSTFPFKSQPFVCGAAASCTACAGDLFRCVRPGAPAFLATLHFRQFFGAVFFSTAHGRICEGLPIGVC